MKPSLLNALALGLLLLLGNVALGQTKPEAILGNWLSEKKDGKIEIYRQGDKFYGRLIWTTRPDALDAKNPDAKLRGRKIVGAVILTDVRHTGTTWEGNIYDPESGKTYNCTLKLQPGGKTLDLRGYVGLSMFGRTSVWTRI